MRFYQCDSCGRLVSCSDTPHWVQCTGLCDDCHYKREQAASNRKSFRQQEDELFQLMNVLAGGKGGE